MIDSNDVNVDLSQIINNDFDNKFIWGLSETISDIKEPFNDDLNNNANYDVFSIKNTEGSAFLLNYKEEINRIKQLGISNFRFSLSWSRIIPNGIGTINQEAIDFYSDIIDTCIINGIEPFVTLCNWNLPEEIEKKGGWANREIINWFQEYISACIKAFRNKVKYWIVLNEPSVITRVEYYLEIQKDRKRGENNFLPALHHSLLCQAIGFEKIKNEIPNSQVGTTFLSTYIVPKTTSFKDVRAANRVDALLNRTFIEPSLGFGYPIETLPFLKGIKRYFVDGDDKLIIAKFDFVGIQNYSQEIVAHNMYVPFINAQIFPSQKINSKNTSVNLEIDSKTIYLMIKKYSLYEGVKKIIIIENEALIKPKVELKNYNDLDCFDLKKSNLEQILLAKKIGGKIAGYFTRSYNAVPK
jgi:beta-glucosidase